MTTSTLPRPPFMAVAEFADRDAYPVAAASLDEAEHLALAAAAELPGLVRVSVYRWAGHDDEYVVVQTLNRTAH